VDGPAALGNRQDARLVAGAGFGVGGLREWCVYVFWRGGGAWTDRRGWEGDRPDARGGGNVAI
jgi:hypothetical protein